MSNNTKGNQKAGQRLICIMGLFYLIQAYGSLPGLFGLPLTIYLKENLELSPSQLATFSSTIFLPWTIRPFYGIMGDAVSMFGYQFKSYFLICYTLALAVFLGLSSFQFYTIFLLTSSITLINIFIAFSDVLTDKIMVVQGRILGNTARLQAAQWTALGFGKALLYYVSGWLAQNSNLSTVFLLTAIVPLIGLISASLLFRKEKKQKTISIRSSLESLGSALKSQQLLAIIGFIACLEFTLVPPLVNYIIYYYKDVLKFDAQAIGSLGTCEAFANGLGAIVFGIFAFKVSRQLLLNLAIGLTAVSTLGLLFVQDIQSAIVVSVFFGFFAMIAMLGVLEIAARACPIDVEGSIYALLMSVYILAKQPGPILGGYLYDWGVPVSTLVIVSALFTALCWFLIPLLKLNRPETSLS